MVHGSSFEKQLFDISELLPLSFSRMPSPLLNGHHLERHGTRCGLSHWSPGKLPSCFVSDLKGPTELLLCHQTLIKPLQPQRPESGHWAPKGMGLIKKVKGLNILKIMIGLHMSFTVKTVKPQNKCKGHYGSVFYPTMVPLMLFCIC